MCTCHIRKCNENTCGCPCHRSKVFISVLIALFLCLSAPAWAFTDQEAVHAVLGEARQGESYPAMYAVACAIRNRGTLQGVCGAEAPMEPIEAKTSDLAVKAWYTSEAGPDTTKGAQYWLSDWDLTHCRPELIAWRLKMTETLYIGQTHYYREGK